MPIASGFEPSYLRLHASGELHQRISDAWAMLAPCRLCPHECGADRLHGQLGVCRMDDRCKVAAWNLHRWEEPPISGTRGSGAIFFSGCTGRCCFCQNFPVSQMRQGIDVGVERLAGMMLEMQRKGAHNINLVTPTHFMPHVLAALPHAVHAGLRLPLVYNTSGYERVEALRLLDGVIDIWLPDAKYAEDDIARRLSGWPRYVENNQLALREIFRQVGDELLLGEGGIALRGLIVRHLVLPGGLSGAPQVLRWLSGELSHRVHVSLMDQYFPAYRVLDDPVLGRRLSLNEYELALEALESAGLEHGWTQATGDWERSS
ncbi:MAG TPA: radical SAM protein [Anaerolineae bacterium]|nr:radical SAM protein [Anaerolineae bacterium]